MKTFDEWYKEDWNMHLYERELGKESWNAVIDETINILKKNAELKAFECVELIEKMRCF